MPGVEYDQIDFTFSGGLDENADPKLLQPGSVAEIENGEFDKRGTLNKRPGYAILADTVDGSANTLVGGRRLIRHESPDGEELLLVGAKTGVEHRLYSYSKDQGQWTDADDVPSCWVKPQAAARHGDNHYQYADRVVTSDLDVLVWQDFDIDASTFTVRARVVDVNSGTVLRHNEQLNTVTPGTQARVIVLGTKVLCIYADSSATLDFYFRSLDTTDVPSGWSAEAAFPTGTPITDMNAVPEWDVVALEADTNGVLIYKSATPDVQLVRFDSDGAFTHSVQVSADINITAVGVYGRSGEDVYAAWCDTTAVTGGLKYRVHSPTTVAATAGPLTIDDSFIGGVGSNCISVGRFDASTALVAYHADMQLSDTSGGPTVTLDGTRWKRCPDSATGASTFDYQTRCMRLHSHIWTYNGRQYAVMNNGFVATKATPAWTASKGPSGTTYYVCEFTQEAEHSTLRPVAMWANETGGADYREESGPVTATGTVATKGVGTVVHAAYGVLLTAGQSNAVSVRGSNTIDIHFDHAEQWQSAQLAESSVVSGGMLSQWDGAQLTECGFLYRPFVNAGNERAGGALTASSDYQVAVAYEYYDAQGNLHRSFPTQLTTAITLAVGEQQFDIEVAHYHLTTRQDDQNGFEHPVHIAVYLSAPDGTDLYRWNPEGSVNAVPNDPQATDVETITIDSLVSTDAEPLYTGSGELGNDPAGSVLYVASGKNRVAGVRDDLRTVMFSKEKASGIGLSWSEALGHRIDEGGDITGLSIMDNAWVVFKKRQVHLISGDGPDATGANGAWRSHRVETDVGCIDSRSIVRTPKGIIFQSDNNFRILYRNFTVGDIGFPVEDTLNSYPIVTSATLDEGRNQVIFTCSDSGGEGMRFLVLDYHRELWTVWKVDGGTTIFDSAVYWQGNHCIAARTQTTGANSGTASTVMERDTTVWTDDQSWYGLVVVSPWFSFENVQSYKSCRQVHMLGTRKEAYGGFKIQVGYDYAAAYTDTLTWTEAQVGSEWQNGFRVRQSQRKALAYRLKIEDTVPSPEASAETYDISSLRFEVGLQKRSRYMASGATR